MQSHQELGDSLNLFFIDQYSPGSIFWKPRGALLYNNLIAYMRQLYKLYGYQEVITPNIYDKKLWQKSGHWDKYRENMFLIQDNELDQKDA
jgi:threonyl-tRNA synthetase